MEIPEDPPFDVADELRSERDRLLRLLDGLDESQWGRPTRCPGWSILDLAVHLVGDDLSFVSWQRDSHHGTAPPDGLDGDGFITWLDELQVEWVRAARRLSPRLAVELLTWLGDAVIETVRAQDPSAVDANVSWASWDPVPRWLDHGRELTERWIHRQQILDALGRPTDSEPETLRRVLDVLRWAFPLGLRAQPVQNAARVLVSVEGSQWSESWTLVADGDRWRFADGSAETVHAQLRVTAEQAWRLLTNNLEPAIHGEPVTVGDPRLSTALLRTRAIIGRPT